jgi:glycosyltransferase involved in cell wall biosynthesis
VIPALNEEGGIAAILERVLATRATLQAIGIEELETIVVDDGSRDRTVEIVEGFPEVRLLRHPINRGYGAAIKTGFAQAGGDLVAFLDADGTYPPERFGDLCQVAREQDADIVVGSRRSGAASQMPAVRRLGNVIWSNLVSVIGNHRVADPASGMRVLRRSALARLSPLPDGLNFTPVMSTRAVHEGLHVVEVPIAYSERVGRSKLSIVRDGTRFLTTIVSTSLEYNPVRVLGLIGLTALTVAAVIGLVILALRLQGVAQLGLWGIFGVYAALILTVVGVSLFALGATFNYLVSLFRGRPVRQGLFGRPLFATPLDRQFGWLGLAGIVGGMLLGGLTLGLAAVNGWEVDRAWFWLLVSSLILLVGLQLLISWVVMRILERLSEQHLRSDAASAMVREEAPVASSPTGA